MHLSKQSLIDLEVLKQKKIAVINASYNEALLKNILDMLSTDEVELNVDDTAITLLCMYVSEKSLSQAWDNEDDERWNAFL